jgi:hypothetical protein
MKASVFAHLCLFANHAQLARNRTAIAFASAAQREVFMIQLVRMIEFANYKNIV